MARIAAPIFMNLVGKSPDYGARIYLTGALAGPKDHVSRQTAQQGASSGGHEPWYKATIEKCSLTSLDHRANSCVIILQTRSTPADPHRSLRARRPG